MTISFGMSVRPSAWNNLVPTGRIFIKFDICEFSESLPRKFKFYYNQTSVTGTLHEDQHIFLIILAQFVLEGETFQSKFGEKIKTHFMFNNFFFRKSCPL